MVHLATYAFGSQVREVERIQRQLLVARFSQIEG